MTTTHESTAAEASSSYLVMHDLMLGLFVTQALHVAAELGIADLLRHGPKTAGELAQATGVSERALFRVLRMLASKQVFAEHADGRFATTPVGRTLEAATSELLDVVMLGVFGERAGERTQAEHAGLLEASGFRFARLLPTRSSLSVVEGVPI